MRTLGTPSLATADHLLPHADVRINGALDGTGPLERSPGQNLETSKVMLVKFLHRVQQVAVQRHYATWTGANNLVTVRLSVSVQPWGGVMRSE